jgi:hypothetical protein
LIAALGRFSTGPMLLDDQSKCIHDGVDRLPSGYIAFVIGFVRVVEIDFQGGGYSDVLCIDLGATAFGARVFAMCFGS